MQAPSGGQWFDTGGCRFQGYHLNNPCTALVPNTWKVRTTLILINWSHTTRNASSRTIMASVPGFHLENDLHRKNGSDFSRNARTTLLIPPPPPNWSPQENPILYEILLEGIMCNGAWINEINVVGYMNAYLWSLLTLNRLPEPVSASVTRIWRFSWEWLYIHICIWDLYWNSLKFLHNTSM